mmetsp:Transcript_80145/g.217011  ORF Transcript_80145/g.217011 Transcript_80145/m.217011 type:complete len:366 (+) Transcript_80145:37-1134(+)
MGTDPDAENGLELQRGGLLAGVERSGLLHEESFGVAGGQSSSMRSRVLDRTHSQNLVPDATRSLLQSREDHQEFVAWQEGGGEDQEQAESNGEAVSAPSGAKKYDQATIFGIDKRPFFPTVLIVSLLWSMCMTWLQSWVIADLFGGAFRCNTFFLVVYILTIGAALNTSLSNPGLMSEEQFRKWQDGQTSIPMRAHKHWLYRRPVQRFHQYCRWVTNCVGLRNHRSYMIMLLGFVTTAVADTIVDLILVPVHFVSGTWTAEFLCLLHLCYSIYFAWYSAPLLRQHTAFIMRNELTQEWKRDDYYVVVGPTGEKIAVTDLDAEDYNRLFDEFEYDSSRNPFDKGWVDNCISFWTRSRDDPDEWGEF